MEAAVSYLLMLNKTYQFKIYQFKVKNPGIKDYPLCLGNISKDFAIYNIKKTRLKARIKFFSVGFDPIDANDISNVQEYLMWKT